MDSFSRNYEARWADIDPNRHMRHSAYNDYAAQTRVAIFSESGFTMDTISKLGIGPILFREEVRFLREVHMSEIITVFCYIKQMRKDGTRWTFVHPMYKNDDLPIAEITVDGAWLDLQTRKLGTPPDKLLNVILSFPRTDDFKWMEE